MNLEDIEYSGLEELLSTEVMNNYNSYIVGMAMKYAQNPQKVIDFGAGIGTLSLIFRDKYSIDPVCVEIDQKNREFLAKRGLTIQNELSSTVDDVDLIFSSNVLEHIEDDVFILRQMANKINADGKIFLYLPARMLLWSKLDEEVGHYRRYEYAELKNKCESAGLRLDALHFADSIGFFASFSMKLFGYNKDTGIGSAASLKFYDKWLFPISKILDTLGFKYCLGKNIILVASKI